MYNVMVVMVVVVVVQVPPGVFNVITCPREFAAHVGAEMANNPKVRREETQGGSGSHHHHHHHHHYHHSFSCLPRTHRQISGSSQEPLHG